LTVSLYALEETNTSNNTNNTEAADKPKLSNSRKKPHRMDDLFNDKDGKDGFIKSEKDEEKFQVPDAFILFSKRVLEEVFLEIDLMIFVRGVGV
jgi:hypothetical protein